MELDSAAKKPRMEDPTSQVTPSKVLHLRNLPSDVTDKEIIMLGLPFSQVTNVLLLRHKNQAFLEMGDVGVATTMVGYYTTMPAQIRDRTVYVQYSKHQELKTTSVRGVAEQHLVLLQPASGGASNGPGYDGAAGQAGLVGGMPQGAPNSILRVIIENMIYPITIDVLHQIFSKYGNVMKVVTFMKNGQFHALIQFPDTLTANTAKTALDGQNIYNGCCTLRIDYSKLASLTVKYNNEKTRDFTRADLPTGESDHAGALPELQLAGIPPSLLQSPAFSNLRAAIAAYVAPGSGAAAAAMGGSCVVLASNLNEKMISPHALFVLFGIYGDVMRVKILYNKRDSTLIQFREPQQAQNSVNYLNGAMLYGKKMHVTLSKHSQVQMPQPGSNEDGLTEDYSNSPLHRFKKPGSKNYQNIFPPSATLHLSNIPEGVTEEYLRSLFTSTGGNVVSFRFFQNDRKMALIQMSDVEEATAAVIVTHNHKISETNHLRVTFSKNTI